MLLKNISNSHTPQTMVLFQLRDHLSNFPLFFCKLILPEILTLKINLLLYRFTHLS